MPSSTYSAPSDLVFTPSARHRRTPRALPGSAILTGTPTDVPRSQPRLPLRLYRRPRLPRSWPRLPSHTWIWTTEPKTQHEPRYRLTIAHRTFYLALAHRPRPLPTRHRRAPTRAIRDPSSPTAMGTSPSPAPSKGPPRPCCLIHAPAVQTSGPSPHRPRFQLRRPHSLARRRIYRSSPRLGQHLCSPRKPARHADS
jgi:hypothetical protein